MKRIRTIDQAYDEIKKQDPQTAISRYLGRQMVKQGMVPSLPSGNKRLVDVDVLERKIEELTGRLAE